MAELEKKLWKSERKLWNESNRGKILRDVGRRIAKTWEGGKGLVRSFYRSRIVKNVFTMFTLGAEKREIFRPGRLNFRPLHNTIHLLLLSDKKEITIDTT